MNLLPRSRRSANLLVATTLAALTASTPPHLRAQDRGPDGARAACEAVFEALRSDDETSFRSTLPDREALRAFLQSLGTTGPVGDPTTLERTMERMVGQATRRFHSTRAEAAEHFDWTSARFLCEIPPTDGDPTTAESRFEVGRLAFLVFADGQVWQFGARDALRDGEFWSFTEGPFFHGPCDPQSQAESESRLQAAQDDLRALERLCDERLAEQRREADRERVAWEQRLHELERTLRDRFAEEMLQEHRQFETYIRELREDADRRIDDYRQRLAEQLEDAMRAVHESEIRVDRMEAQAAAAMDQVTEVTAERDDLRSRIEELQLERDGLRAAIERRSETRSTGTTEVGFEKRLDQPVSLSVRRAEPEALIRCLGEATGLPIVVGTDFLLGAESVEVGENPTRTVRQWIDEAVGPMSRCTVDGSLALGFGDQVTPVDAATRSVPESLRTRVAVRLEDMPALDVVSAYLQMTGLQLWLTESGSISMSDQHLSLVTTGDLSISTIFDLIAAETGCRWSVVDRVVLWADGDPEPVDPLPFPLPIGRDHVASVESPEQAVVDRLASWSRAFGVNLRLSPELLQEVVDAEPMMPARSLRQVGLETVLKLLEIEIEQTLQPGLSWQRSSSGLVLGRAMTSRR